MLDVVRIHSDLLCSHQTRLLRRHRPQLPSRTSMIGTLLADRYLLLEKLSGGGFSETYLAHDRHLPESAQCIVKHLQLAPNSPVSPLLARRCFANEAFTLKQLGAFNGQIPVLLAFQDTLEPVYLVQEYIQGESLDRWVVTNRKIAVPVAQALLSDVLSILDYLHRHRVIHGDIKPANLVCRAQDQRFALIDFGAAVKQSASEGPIACRQTLGGAPNAHDGFAVGTPGYMPPEQLEGSPQPNSDLYALGISVLQLVTGLSPQQLETSPANHWQQHLPRAFRNSPLRFVLKGLVQPDYRERYSCAADVLANLAALPCHASEGIMGLVELRDAQFLCLDPRPLTEAGRLKPTPGLLAKFGNWLSKPQPPLEPTPAAPSPYQLPLPLEQPFSDSLAQIWGPMPDLDRELDLKSPTLQATVLLPEQPPEQTLISLNPQLQLPVLSADRPPLTKPAEPAALPQHLGYSLGLIGPAHRQSSQDRPRLPIMPVAPEVISYCVLQESAQLAWAEPEPK
jgi:serine/threonine protein kinase